MCRTLDLKLYSLFQYLYVHKYVDQKGSAAMPAVKRSAGVPPEVNLGNYCYCLQMMKHARKRFNLALKPKADFTRSPNQGYQWPHKQTKNWKILSWKSDPVIPIYILALSSIALTLPWPSLTWQNMKTKLFLVLKTKRNI